VRARRLLVAALAVVAGLTIARAAAAGCGVTIGGHVSLQSDAVDPDVFLWDSRDRMVEFAAGQWGNTRAIFAHTMLAEPGTQALIVSCFPSVAHPKFSTSGDQDAIGVKVLNGPYRGRYGWVLSSDIHPMHTGNAEHSASGTTIQAAH